MHSESAYNEFALDERRTGLEGLFFCQRFKNQAWQNRQRKLTKTQVLIIEDDRDTAGFFKTVLELGDFECEVILSAKEALARLSVGAPDIILLDVRLGIEISGEDILYQIRSNPRFDRTRVVVVTAYPRLAEPITNLADLVLVKPVEVDQLKNLMQRLGGLEFKSKFQVYRDPVTELFNEEFFLTRLELAFERAKRRATFHFGVIAIYFQLEAQPGEPVSPEATLAILREISGRLKKFVRPTDAVARLANWKFATLHEDLNEPEDIKFIVKRLTEKLSHPFEIDGQPYAVKCELVPVVHSPLHRQPFEILKSAQERLSAAHSGEQALV
jgi:PleD family two-component response regulator